MKTLDGKSFIIGGASRSGKTWFTLLLFAIFRRVMAWDPEDQWSKVPGFIRVTSLARLVQIAAATTHTEVKIAYVPGPNLRKEFDVFCRVLFRWVDEGAPAAGILEELADVVPVGKAEGGYGVLVRRGLKRGLWMAHISQRWQEASKSAFGNASEFIFFEVSDAGDADYLGKKVPAIPANVIAGLRQYDYVRYNKVNRSVTRGRMPGK